VSLHNAAPFTLPQLVIVKQLVRQLLIVNQLVSQSAGHRQSAGRQSAGHQSSTLDESVDLQLTALLSPN